jgi:hypothetical protein
MTYMSGLAALAAGTLGLVGGIAAPAMADTTDTGGSTTLTADNTFLINQAKAGIAEIPQSPATTTVSSTGVVTVTLPVTGGNANISILGGTLDLGGSLKFVDVKTRKCVTFSSLQLSYDTGQLSGVPSGGTSQVPLDDLSGNISYSVSGTTQTLTTDSLIVDPAGASYLDSVLHTTFYGSGGQNVATGFNATYTTATS